MWGRPAWLTSALGAKALLEPQPLFCKVRPPALDGPRLCPNWEPLPVLGRCAGGGLQGSETKLRAEVGCWGQGVSAQSWCGAGGKGVQVGPWFEASGSFHCGHGQPRK